MYICVYNIYYYYADICIYLSCQFNRIFSKIDNIILTKCRMHCLCVYVCMYVYMFDGCFLPDVSAIGVEPTNKLLKYPVVCASSCCSAKVKDV